MSGAHLDEVYSPLPFEAETANGVWLKTRDGREVLDLYGGHAVAALGYGHPRLVSAIADQTAAMLFQSNVVRVAVRERAADKLAQFAGQGLERVFFVNSGAEANENALRLACTLTGRSRIVAIEHSFHGRSAAASAVTYGSEKWYGFPRTPFDVEFVPRDDVERMHAAVGDDVAAVIVEPVQGLAGAYDLSIDFLRAARSACDAAGAMLIFDEIQTGMGRLGAAFGANLYSIAPDLLTTAKGLAGGLPAGALLMRSSIAAELKAGQLGTTFGGGPVVSAAIEAVIDTIIEERLLDHVARMSAFIRDRGVVGPVTGVRGRGLLVGLTTTIPARDVRDALLARNILTGTSTDSHVLRLLPPLIVQAEHLDKLFTALGELDDGSL